MTESVKYTGKSSLTLCGWGI